MTNYIIELIKLYFTKFKFISIYINIKKYLPRERFNEFKRAWIINHLIRAPILRRKLERHYNCALPFIINISPSEKCNLSCLGCYASNYKQDKEMTTEEFRNIIIQAADLNVSMIGILGGEPLMRKDILKIIPEFKQIAFRISTNGTFLDEEIISFLRDNGNVVINFSIEGNSEYTNQWRGNGVYETIVQNMSRLRKEKVLFGVSVLLHNKNKDLIATHEFFKRIFDLGNRFALFFPYGPVGKNQLYEYVIDEEELEYHIKKIFTISRSYPIVTLVEGYFLYFMNRKSKIAFECTSGRNLHITPEGYIEPCNGIQFYTDNIFKSSLIESLKSPYLRAIQEATLGKNKCIAIYRPAKVIEISQANKVKESHNLSFQCYDNFVKYLINKQKSYY